MDHFPLHCKPEYLPKQTKVPIGGCWCPSINYVFQQSDDVSASDVTDLHFTECRYRVVFKRLLGLKPPLSIRLGPSLNPFIDKFFEGLSDGPSLIESASTIASSRSRRFRPC